MARSGITKAQVRMARERLLDRGERPTVDAVRVELGNTGSKATIHRYLKELGEESPVHTAASSDTLSDLVVRLAFQLRQESQEALEQAYKIELDHLNEGEGFAKEADNRVAELEAAKADLERQKVELDKANSKLSAEIGVLRQQFLDLEEECGRLHNQLESEKHERLSREVQIARVEALNCRIQKELEVYQRRLEDSYTERKVLELELARIQSELAVKDQLFEKLSLRLMIKPEETE